MKTTQMPQTTSPTTKSKSAVLSAANDALAEKTLGFDAFLQRLGPKDRLNAERHLSATSEVDAAGQHAQLWRRLTGVLMGLSGHSAKLNGRQSLQFYIADGKYRMQVFALEDLVDGKISLYCGDVREEAAKAGLLLLLPNKTRLPDEGTPPVGIAGTDQTLDIEPLSGRSANVAPFFKDMLGWNRTAIRIVLRVQASEKQIRAAEQICAISALKWINQPATAKSGK